MNFTLNNPDPNPFTDNASKLIHEAMERELRENRNATITELVYEAGSQLCWDSGVSRESFSEPEILWMAGVAYALKEK